MGAQRMNMTKVKFYKLKTIEKGCSRRTLFGSLKSAGKVKGVSQYYPKKMVYIKTKLFDYIANKFSSAKVLDDFPYKVGGRFDIRLEREDVMPLIDNLEKLIAEHEISIESLNIPVTYESDGIKVGLNCDAKGTFDGDLAIFKLNPTTRFNKEDAYELVCINKLATESDGECYRLVVLKLGNGEIREVLENGDRNKNGSLSKNGLPEWTTLQNETDHTIENVSNILKGIETSPEEYNIPTFGSCATCPYHNVEIAFNGKNIICVG